MLTVYGRAACGPCALTKRKLTAGGVEFNYVDLDENPDILEALGEEDWITGLPVVVSDTADGFRWCSTDPKAIREAITRFGNHE